MPLQRVRSDDPAGPTVARGTWWGPIGVVALIAMVAGLLLAVDEPVYAYVHTHWNESTRPVPTHLKLPTRIMRSMEDWGENVYIACVLYAMWVFDRHKRSRVVLLVTSALVVTLAIEGIKRLTGRERPEFNGGETVFHGPSRWNDGGDYQSFPSGHAGSSSSFSGSLAAFYPPLKPVVIPLAIGCSGNRIWKERHFLSDCWVGGALGFSLAFWLPGRPWVQRLCRRFDDRYSVRDPCG